MNRKTRSQKHGTDMNAMLVTQVGQVACLIRAGLGPSQAWEPLLGCGQTTGNIAADLRAWRDAHVGVDEEYADAILAAFTVCDHVGAPLADVLDSVAEALEDRADAMAAGQAAMSGPRATAKVVVFLPILGVVLGTLIGAHPLTVMLSGGAGTFSLVAGLFLMGGGWLWTRRLIAKAAWKADVSGVLTLVLLTAVLRAGVPLPHALRSVGQACEKHEGASLAHVGDQLIRGVPWTQAWPRKRTIIVSEIESALALAWNSGISPAPLLASSVRSLRRSARHGAEAAAGKVGVYLMAPLGLCYLPAFVALGLVPIIISLAGNLFSS